ncbi:hypothetical protein BV20DRAFT_1116796 [Pilatotrama ljubarskyi]|nr:hypothetical protein BV20DRAFT_1116796 [Pilatotrama ljubarskyi]
MSSLNNLLNPESSYESSLRLQVVRSPSSSNTSPTTERIITPIPLVEAKPSPRTEVVIRAHEPHPDCPDTLACLPDTDGRPQHTLPVILRCTILGSPRKRLTIREIYAAMERKYPYYKTAGPAWKQSVRHHLSLNRLFERQPRPPSDPGFGSYWTVNLDAPPGTKRPRKRGGRSNKAEGSEAGALTVLAYLAGIAWSASAGDVASIRFPGSATAASATVRYSIRNINDSIGSFEHPVDVLHCYFCLDPLRIILGSPGSLEFPMQFPHQIGSQFYTQFHVHLHQHPHSHALSQPPHLPHSQPSPHVHPPSSHTHSQATPHNHAHPAPPAHSKPPSQNHSHQPPHGQAHSHMHSQSAHSPHNYSHRPPSQTSVHPHTQQSPYGHTQSHAPPSGQPPSHPNSTHSHSHAPSQGSSHSHPQHSPVVANANTQSVSTIAKLRPVDSRSFSHASSMRTRGVYDEDDDEMDWEGDVPGGPYSDDDYTSSEDMPYQYDPRHHNHNPGSYAGPSHRSYSGSQGQPGRSVLHGAFSGFPGHPSVDHADSTIERLKMEMAGLRRQSQDAVTASLRLSDELRASQEEAARAKAALKVAENMLEEEARRRIQAEKTAEEESRRRRAAEDTLRQYQAQAQRKSAGYTARP